MMRFKGNSIVMIKLLMDRNTMNKLNYKLSNKEIIKDI